ncbi:hypothetical protein Kpol_1067p9 [Vanderwaltozyma polyspora DSM 70294]|uniref:Clathrin/coatomer adaptor adaptin-like N-terminal domain-containing protein n=1 Tax=Vanderwaltozyma polyspora (strain ATCC 22028 / DSM 70294 / BCRC 21397 / CBS 2163 / NBRC 10782 / NRRL Y-8283 / UCD 57-17) TaxID=436907 RepID=A7TNV4_VANPO|nr:uncharacterized protein Kpol_1067p9 [Vanderwaltozyma polyspora DSM 70294]EDO16037.1 hypothetical protein Kpol_1067p9 [Vanderwaltozyma polyspora DSM 70294]
MVDSISRIASALESAKDITMEAAAVASSKFGESYYAQYSKNITPEQLRMLLNSRYTTEVKDGMKRIISLMASGDNSIDPEAYFADVVKNIVSEDYKVKSMVCVYLLKFAEREPSLALLPVNSIQKLVTDIDPKVRSLSIKALSDIKIPSLYPILLHTLKKLISDSSPIVRNEVCFALLKLYREKPVEIEEEVLILLKDLLSDSDPQVLSGAILLFNECFPDRLELLHRHYRYFCEMLRYLDPWSQAILIRIIIRYSKEFLPQPVCVDLSTSGGSEMPLSQFFSGKHYPSNYKTLYHPDLELFFDNMKYLIFSSSPAVISECVNSYYQLSTPRELQNTGMLKKLVNVATSSTNFGVKCSLFEQIVSLAICDPSLFSVLITKFYLLPSDQELIAIMKLKTLSIICAFNTQEIVSEMKYQIAYNPNPNVVTVACDVLVQCCAYTTARESRILEWLIKHMESKKLQREVLDSIINIIRKLVQKNPQKHLRATIKLANILRTQPTLADNARAGIVWLFGELASIEFRICPDILLQLIPRFSKEGPETRLQTLLLSAKLATYEIDGINELPTDAIEDAIQNSRIMKMYDTVIYLSKFDDEFDIRDRARFISSIFETRKYEIAKLLFQAPKPTVQHALQNQSDCKRSLSQDEAVLNVVKDSQFQTRDILPWNENVKDTNALREPAQLKDYSRYQKSFSSTSYSSGRMSSKGEESTTYKVPKSPGTPKGSFTSNQGKKYKLQSLDEFFSDIPTRTVKPKRKIVIQEESSSEETSDSEQEASENEGSDESSSSTSTSCTESSLNATTNNE